MRHKKLIKQAFFKNDIEKYLGTDFSNIQWGEGPFGMSKKTVILENKSTVQKAILKEIAFSDEIMDNNMTLSTKEGFLELKIIRETEGG